MEDVSFYLIRVGGGIVGGIGFLGAGAIIQPRGEVKGLTTTAGIRPIAAVGFACGAGAYVIAGTSVAMAYPVLAVLHFLKRRLAPEQVGDNAGSSSSH